MGDLDIVTEGGCRVACENGNEVNRSGVMDCVREFLGAFHGCIVY